MAMKGLLVILVVVLITISGTFASEISDENVNVETELSFFETDKHFPGAASLVDDQYNFEDNNNDELVPAREFTIGRMTGQSLAVSSWVYNKLYFYHLIQLHSFSLFQNGY